MNSYQLARLYMEKRANPMQGVQSFVQQQAQQAQQAAVQRVGQSVNTALQPVRERLPAAQNSMLAQTGQLIGGSPGRAIGQWATAGIGQARSYANQQADSMYQHLGTVPRDRLAQYMYNPQDVSGLVPESMGAWVRPIAEQRLKNAPWSHRATLALSPTAAIDLARRRMTDPNARLDMSKVMGDVGGGLMHGLKFLGAGIAGLGRKAAPYLPNRDDWRRYLQFFKPPTSPDRAAVGDPVPPPTS